MERFSTSGHVAADYAAFINPINSFSIVELLAAYREIFPAPLPFPHPDPERQVLPAADYERFTEYVYHTFPLADPRQPPPASSSSAEPAIVLNEYRMQVLAHLWGWEPPLVPAGAVTQKFIDHMMNDINEPYADLGVFIREYRVHVMVNLTQPWTTSLTGDAIDLIHNLLQADPARRLTIAQVRAHPWMRQG